MSGNAAFYSEEMLLAALAALVRGIGSPAQAEKIISESVELAVTGLGADRGGLYLLRPHPASLRLEALCSFGITEQRLRAIECGKDLHDAAVGTIWKLAANGLASDAGLSLSKTASDPLWCRDSNLYVTCVPVRDPVLDAMVAILHLEKECAHDSWFERAASQWISAVALTLGQILHLGFRAADSCQEASDCNIETLENAPELIGVSVQTQALRNELHEIYIPAAGAPDPEPILILGEKGTGKDLVARYTHAYSARRNRPYVAVNCAEITDELATARFFGHKKGSFTGSMANEPGLFRAADRGILLLDEIGELSLKSQATLLRVLENRTVVPLGETKEQRVDVQVILSTNREPEEAVAEGLMRPDLLDRFGTQTIRLSPLRERPWDIPALVRHFIAFHERRTQKKVLAVHGDVLKAMTAYSWPGNVRELARACSSLIAHLRPGAPVDLALVNRILPQIGRAESSPKASVVTADEIPMRQALEIFGRELIMSRLRQHQWNIRSARESLGLPKTTFRRYMRELGIDSSVPDPSTELGPLPYAPGTTMEERVSALG